MKRRCLYFTKPFELEIREESLPAPGPGQLLIETQVSGISAGTELLFYTGQQPRRMALDASLPHLEGSADYPLSYGYALAGRIVGLGAGLDPALLHRMAFAFHPHATHALINREEAVLLPPGMDGADAIFFPNMETAVNLVMDGAPLFGERVIVLGLGVIGLLTAALLRQFPLQTLYGIDRLDFRREKGLELGLDACFGDGEAALLSARQHTLSHNGESEGDAGFDLCYELSGNPVALDAALGLCGFNSRICVGSWYGTKTHPINLGGDFHRNRIRLFSSQVSTLAPELSGRWTKERRAQQAWKQVARMKPQGFITHRIPFERCQEAYELLHKGSANLLQVVLTYH